MIGDALAGWDALAERYRRLTLVSHRRHVERLLAEAPVEGRLVVSTDWLAWRRAVEAGLDAVLFDSALVEWPAELGDPATLHQRGCEWVYLDGGDATLFHGVSLGKLFTRQVTLFRLHYGRAWAGMDRLCRRFRPDEVELLDLRGRHDLIGRPEKRALLAEMEARHGCRVIDRLDEPAPGDPLLPEQPVGVGQPERDASGRVWLRRLYAAAVDLAFRLRTRRPGVFMVLNWAAQGALLDAYDGKAPPPVLVAGQMPKSPGFLLDCWRKGVVLAALPERPLDAGDRAGLDAIRRAFAQAWSVPAADPVTQGLRLFLQRTIFDSGWLDREAVEVKRYAALFRRHPVARVLVGDATNNQCRTVAELARRHGAGVDEMLNGMFLSPQRYDSRCGDTGRDAVVQRLLARGPADEAWAAATGARLAVRRTGYPVVTTIAPEPKAVNPRGNALVLPVYADCDDVKAVGANVFRVLHELVAGLSGLGCAGIRVKLHVGVPCLSYYQAALAGFGDAVEVVKDNAFARHLAWADYVVGPVNTGAWLETLAAGKPYYPLLPEPTLIDRALLGPARALTDAAELVAMLERAELPPHRAVLEHFVGAEADPSAAVWRALAESP